MRLRHNPDGKPRNLATEVEVADGLFSRGLGLMFRRSIPDDYALAFRHDAASSRGLHMLFVPFDIDVVWTVDEEGTLAVEVVRQREGVFDDFDPVDTGETNAVDAETDFSAE